MGKWGYVNIVCQIQVINLVHSYFRNDSKHDCSTVGLGSNNYRRTELIQ